MAKIIVIRSESIVRFCLSSFRNVVCIGILFLSAYGAENTLLVFRNAGINYEQVLKGLNEELAKKMKINDIIVPKNFSKKDVEKYMAKYKPDVVVLMDNNSITPYKEYQADLPDDTYLVPTISLMGVLINKTIRGLKNATGINYEIPIVTSAVNLRYILNIPLKKIGVIHREYLAEFLEKNRVYCANEGIEIKDILIRTQPDKDYRKGIRKAFKKLAKVEEVEAIWVPNDNSIINSDYIVNLWLPLINRYGLPIIVGVKELVDPKINFGSYAVLPDHVSMGSQAAELIFDIMDNDWQVDTEVEQPLSVYQIINLKQIRLKNKIPPEKLRNIEKVVK